LKQIAQKGMVLGTSTKRRMLEKTGLQYKNNLYEISLSLSIIFATCIINRRFKQENNS
jgi:hypothetical protein